MKESVLVAKIPALNHDYEIYRLGNINKLSTMLVREQLGTVVRRHDSDNKCWRSNSTLIKIVLSTYGGRSETLMTIGYNPIITTINRKRWCYNAPHTTSLHNFLSSYPSFS